MILPEVQKYKHQAKSRSERKLPITQIVIHATVGGLAGSLSWLTNPSSRVSADFVISKGGAIYQLNDYTKYYTWHAGECFWNGQTDFNKTSISIELENTNTGKDPYLTEQLSALTRLVRALMAEYQIASHQIFRHVDICFPRRRKSDPAGFPWEPWKQGLAADVFPHVIANRLNIRQEPSILSPIVGSLRYGTVIHILEKREDGWGRIDQGYVSLQYVANI